MIFGDIPTLAEWTRESRSFWGGDRRLKPKLVKIDDLVGRYHRVMFQGKVNILYELRNAIADWAADKIDRDTRSGRWAAMRALEAVVLRKLAAMVGWEGRKYTGAVCIGYRVGIGAYPSSNPYNRAHAEQLDVGRRIECLTAAIKKAYSEYYQQALAVGRDADTDRVNLKIFMAPEFYFRPRTGAYDGMWPIPEIFQKMRIETGKEKYRDWLFVFGSVVTGSRYEVATIDQGLILDNYALIQEGGPDAGDDRYVQKEFTSHIDFLNPTGLGYAAFYAANQPTTNVRGVNEPLNFPTGSRAARAAPLVLPLPALRVSELAGGAIFTAHGIRFGLEVCRDHYMKRLATSREAGSIQIQLVPAGGMDIDDNAIASMLGGIVFNVDSSGAGEVNLKIRQVAAPPLEPDVRQAAIPGNTHVPAGRLHIYNPYPIPYPGVRNDVAQRLRVDPARL
ncbi:MAG: hypothetical protein SFV18_00630 [Bryobacteraceae bacterium]|nr:hypothetical protein [Bryobacteraceae bacterium]